jgi:hypothetical protein
MARERELAVVTGTPGIGRGCAAQLAAAGGYSNRAQMPLTLRALIDVLKTRPK